MRKKDAEKLGRVFAARMGFAAELENPRMLSQKLCALRLRPADPLCAILSDAENQREYLRAKQHERRLLRLHASFTALRKIPWQDFPERFLLRARHLPDVEIRIDKRSRGWKRGAIREAKRLAKMRAEAESPAKERRIRRLLRAEYAACRPGILVLEPVEGRNLRAYCLNGAVRALYWADLPTEFFAPTGERIGQSGSPLQLHEKAAPGSLGELCAFCEEIAEGFAFVRIDLIAAESGFRFKGLQFFEDTDILRVMLREIDLELGSMLHL